MRLLVLGGTAFLGREVARAALVAGHDVSCVARGRSGTVPEGATHVRHDRAEAGLGGAEERDWDAVLDVTRDPGQVRRAVAALAGRVGHVVFVSTGNVYADHSVVGADESTPLLAPLDQGGEDPDAYGGAKVACEEAYLGALDADRVLIARAGLIGGPGDESGRGGYYPWRFARPAVPTGVAVPDALGDPAQLLDVRDLAAWLVRCAAGRVAGVVDAVGPTVSLGAVIAASRQAAGSPAHPVPLDPGWLAEQGVDAWMGPRSLPLWLPFADHAGFAARRGDAARTLGLTTRPLLDTLRDTLAYEEQRPAEQPRRAGLTDDDERVLLEAWHARR